MDTKAQIKSFETIGVLMVFFFLLIFGVVFYTRIQMSSLEKQESQNQQIHAVNVALKLSYLPELDCVQTGVVKQNCFDLLKMRELAKQTSLTAPLQSRLVYAQLFEQSQIVVHRLDDNGAEKETIVLYNNTGTEGRFMMQMPVKVYDPVADRYDFGYAEVSVYNG